MKSDASSTMSTTSDRLASNSKNWPACTDDENIAFKAVHVVPAAISIGFGLILSRLGIQRVKVGHPTAFTTPIQLVGLSAFR